MRVSQNLKTKVKQAQKDGLNAIAVSKTQNWNNRAYVRVDFEEILNTENGESIWIGRYGDFREMNDDEIGYQDIFIRYN